MFVSVIIPCHNSAATIQRAVDSVISQTWKNWELILVNNNSTDETWGKLLEIKESNPDKKILVLNENKKGAPAARNKGLHIATGEWIQFLDADDELIPEKIAMQVAEITNETDVIFSPYYSIKNEGIYSQYIIKNDLWSALMMSKIGITSSNLFRKNPLLSINGWNEEISSSQDAFLAFALLKENRNFIPLDISLTNIYATDVSITRTRDKNKIKMIIDNYINLRKDILKFLDQKGVDIQAYKKTYNRVFADCYLWYFENSPVYTWKEYNVKTKDNLINRLKTNYSFLRKLTANPNILKNIF